MVLGAAIAPVTGAANAKPRHVAAAHRPALAASASRGRLLWAEHLRNLTAAQTRRLLETAEFDGSGVRDGVRLYRLVYATADPSGRPTTASGLLALPRTRARTFTPVAYTHGTTSYRLDAPSSLPTDEFSAAPAITYAAAGYAAVAPDYLGLGVGPGTQPWFDVASETTASVDMLRAARAYVRSAGDRLAPGVLVTGFSQGASAALGLARALQRGAAPAFRLSALAPESGAYDFTHVELPALVNGTIAGPIAMPYVSYLLVAYNRLHHLYRSESEVFRSPYADRIETLFNSNVPGSDMFMALPSGLSRLLTRQGMQLLSAPKGRFAAALAEADRVCDWDPRVPTRLYFAPGDEQALNANTSSCLARLRTHGSTAAERVLPATDYAGSRHLGSNVAATTATLRWFLRLAPPVS